MNGEIWRDIPGFEGVYRVSNMGRVKSLDRVNSVGHRLKGRILKQTVSQKLGYCYVDLNHGTRKNCTVHRLVASAFLKGNGVSLDVNHIDGDKTNNRVNNLEWSSRKHNMVHAVETGLYPTGKGHHLKGKKIGPRRKRPVSMLASDGTCFIFDGIVTAAAKFQVDPSSISRVCRGLNNTCSGYTWGYVD